MTGGIVMGVISAVNGNAVEVSCPELGGCVTAALPLLSPNHDRYVIDSRGVECPVQERYHIGQWVIVAVCGEDINKGVVIT